MKRTTLAVLLLYVVIGRPNQREPSDGLMVLTEPLFYLVVSLIILLAFLAGMSIVIQLMLNKQYSRIKDEFTALARTSKSDAEEIKELKKRLGVVKEETLQETRRLTDVRKKEVRIQGEQAQSCVNYASSELEQNVEAELERRLGPLERELDEGKSEDREELRKRVEAVTVGAGAAVEERTLAFVQKANSCNERVTGASFKGPTPTK